MYRLKVGTLRSYQSASNLTRVTITSKRSDSLDPRASLEDLMRAGRQYHRSHRRESCSRKRSFDGGGHFRVSVRYLDCMQIRQHCKAFGENWKDLVCLVPGERDGDNAE